jgi:transglutaminase-like putative cysteine protease
MRLEVRYVTEFAYPEPVWESHNVLRARPSDTRQAVLDYRLAVEPYARVTSYRDYWGTWVDAFGVRRAHQVLAIAAESVVETSAPLVPDPDHPVPLEAYRDPATALEHRQFLEPSPHVTWGGDLHAAAAGATEGAATAVDAVQAVNDAVVAGLAYESGATYVGMGVDAVLDQGKGVCQDFAHVAIALCRSIGIPARYVSGYLYAESQADGEMPVAPEVAIQTHAWMEAFVPGFGWWALDPTNALPVGERHIEIGHGRDYDDVMPLRGVYHGRADHRLDVHVKISRDELSSFAGAQSAEQ